MGGGTRHNIQAETNTIGKQITTFLESPRVNINADFDIFEFWTLKEFDSTFHDLYEVSQVILSAPSAQVKVERDFSAFLLVLTHLRTRLSAVLLNSIIVSKLNLDLLDLIDYTRFLPVVSSE